MAYFLKVGQHVREKNLLYLLKMPENACVDINEILSPCFYSVGGRITQTGSL
jgi:hypothetical protein